MHLKSNFSLGVRHMKTFPFDTKRLNFYLSDHIIVSQNPTGLFSMSFEYFNRFLWLTLLINDFFSATRPNNPASCTLFGMVWTFSKSHSSDSISVLALWADKRRLDLILHTINRSVAAVVFLLRTRPNTLRMHLVSLYFRTMYRIVSRGSNTFDGTSRRESPFW